MNHIEEVAKILGVRGGEKFEIEGYANDFRLNEDYGLEVLDPDDFFDENVLNELFVTLLTGDNVIKRKPFKPKYKEVYWYVTVNPAVVNFKYFDGDAIDFYNFNYGNCFRTKEEITDKIKQDLEEKIFGKYDG